MRVLVEAHIQCQLGCYFSDVRGTEGNARYLRSKTIPDTAWNFCIPETGTADEVQWGVAAAATAGRLAAFFVPSNAKIDLPGQRDAAPEHWMVRQPGVDDAPPQPSQVTKLQEVRNSDPGEDFGVVFTSLFADEAINAHFKSYYVPTLRAATRVTSAEPIHLVAYAGTAPVACASLYLCGEYAGLYNVGAVATAQKHGLGRWISGEIFQRAKGRRIFLQCETGTHVEQMYQNLGFSVVATPEIVTLSDNG